MSNLLLTLKGIKSLNRTIWPPYLHVYDDLLIYKKRKWFVLREVTISYNQIAGVEVSQGLLFASIEVITTGIENIKLRFISKKKAKYAKKIIDQKIYHSHAKHQTAPTGGSNTTNQYERGLNRLKEMLAKGMIDQKEFEKRKNEMLKKIF